MKILLSPHNHLSHIWTRWYERRTTVYIHTVLAFLQVSEEALNNNLIKIAALRLLYE